MHKLYAVLSLSSFLVASFLFVSQPLVTGAVLGPSPLASHAVMALVFLALSAVFLAVSLEQHVDDHALSRHAKKAMERHGNGIRHLLRQLEAGNIHTGIGTKHLRGTSLSYARYLDGARVFYRQRGDGIEIVGIADKRNEQAVIDTLREKYS